MRLYTSEIKSTVVDNLNAKKPIELVDERVNVPCGNLRWTDSGWALVNVFGASEILELTRVTMTDDCLLVSYEQTSGLIVIPIQYFPNRPNYTWVKEV